MTLVVETGKGVRNSNSYIPSSFVTSYLGERNRSTESGWDGLSGAEKDAFAIAATDFIEQRWGQRFKGTREFFFEDVKASGTILFTGVSVAAETLLVGDQTYTFVTALSDPDVFNEVLVGGSAAVSASNLFDAITGDADQEGITFGNGTQKNRHVSATIVSATISLVAEAEGLSGDFTAITGPLTNATLTAFSGGDDGGSQTLSFPQSGLFDRAGIRVEGIPLRLKQATAEYAVRAAASVLAPDPLVDDRGGSIVKFSEKVGPIDESTEYSDGTNLAITIRPYPAADRLLQDYVVPAGKVTR